MLNFAELLRYHNIYATIKAQRRIFNRNSGLFQEISSGDNARITR